MKGSLADPTAGPFPTWVWIAMPGGAALAGLSIFLIGQTLTGGGFGLSLTAEIILLAVGVAVEISGDWGRRRVLQKTAAHGRRPARQA